MPFAACVWYLSALCRWRSVFCHNAPSAASASTITAILGVQREASSMPDWASYKAHMEMGFRLGSKQRWGAQRCWDALSTFQACRCLVVLRFCRAFLQVS